MALTLRTPDVRPPLEGWLARMLRRIAAEAGVEAGELSVVLVDDRAMSELHERHKQEAGTTDVLSFDLRERIGEASGAVEGELVVCVDEAARQADRRGHATRLEVLLYAVHGFLHLLDERDDEPAAAGRMHAREDRLLKAVGVGAVYAPRAVDSAEQASSGGG